MKITHEMVLEFPAEQQREIIRNCEYNPKAINTSDLSLIKFSLVALAAGSDTLPLVKNISTANLVLDKQKNYLMRTKSIILFLI